MTPRPRRHNGSALDPDKNKIRQQIGDAQTESKSSSQKPSESDDQTLWIFGYGSLCWKPDFIYLNKTIGRVNGYSRTFWQGNTTHRGTPEKPGRVATLTEDKNGEVWGVGYEVAKNSSVLDYLWHRECFLGGYHIIELTFYPIGEGKGVKGIAYLATPSSPGWLGDAPIEETALQIAEAVGPTGTNIEYVSKLADWIRDNTPVRDPHLDILDILIKAAVEPNECLTAREKINKKMNELKMNPIESPTQEMKSKPLEYSSLPTVPA